MMIFILIVGFILTIIFIIKPECIMYLIIFLLYWFIACFCMQYLFRLFKFML